MMAEYIKRIDAMKICQQHSQQCFNANDVKGQFIAETIEDEIIKIPTVDVTEVRHGKWKEDWKVIYTVAGVDRKSLVGYRCSVCNRPEFFQEPYCNCGAKMDLE